MTILITGADGFIGKYLSNSFNKSQIQHIPLTLKMIDLTNLTNLISFCDKNNIKPSLIIHCATAVRNKNLEYSDNSLAINTIMFNNILYLALKNNSYLINLGSGSDVNRQYWTADMDELTFLKYPPSLDDKHGASKNIISTIIYNSNYEKMLNLRLFGVFGAGEDYSAKLIPNTIAKSILKLPITLVADRFYDYINVNDLSRFLENIARKILNSHGVGENNLWIDRDINFCSGNLTSIFKIASYISNKINPGQVVSLENKSLGKDYGGSVKRFAENFSDFKFTDVYIGIDSMIKYYIEKANTFSPDILLKDSYLDHAKKINV